MAVSLKTPLILVTDDDLVRVSNENPGYRFERESDGSVTVSPTSTRGGAQSGEAFAQLYAYAKIAGGTAFDSSTGFTLDKHLLVKSPDASWVSRPRIGALSDVERTGFWPISPDVVIEVNSPSDDFAETVAKLALYRRHGSSYAVAIDPETREVVEDGRAPEGLVLDFDAIIDA